MEYLRFKKGKKEMELQETTVTQCVSYMLCDDRLTTQTKDMQERITDPFFGVIDFKFTIMSLACKGPSLKIIKE